MDMAEGGAAYSGETGAMLGQDDKPLSKGVGRWVSILSKGVRRWVSILSKGVRRWVSIVTTATSLVLYLLDVGTDIRLAVEYSNKGLAIYFWATLASIIIPHLLLTLMDVYAVYVKNQSTRGANFMKILRIILGLLGLGIIIRKLEIIYFKLSRQKYKVKEAECDCAMIEFICTFTETCPQVLLQLYIFVQNPVPIYRSIGLSIITSVIHLPISYAKFDRTMRRRLSWDIEISRVAFLFYYLGLLGGIIARVLSIALFMGTVSVKYTLIIVLVIHYLGQVFFVWLYISPRLDNDKYLFARLNTFISTKLVFPIMNLFLVFRVGGRKQSWRVITNNLVLYIENFTFLILSFTLAKVYYMEIYILVVGVGCFMHLVFLTIYIKVLHPRVYIGTTTSGSNSSGGLSPLIETDTMVNVYRKTYIEDQIS